MTRWKPTHTGTCAGCGAKRALDGVGMIWSHHLRIPKVLRSGAIVHTQVCPGSLKQPKRGTRRPIEV